MQTPELTTWQINSYYTLIIATIVLLFGRYLVRKYRFLQDFNIPEPVAGGLVAAVIIYALYLFNHVSFAFDKSLREAFMLVFFSSIGLSADFSRLKAGGMPLVIFTIVVGVFIAVQNAVGVGLAVALDQNPLLGLVAGSITMTGGHGTAAGWGPDLEKIGLANATDIGIACATFGLVAGGLIGGPVARRLINKMQRKPLETIDDGGNDTGEDANDMFEKPERKRLITASSAIDTLAMFAACLAFAEIMDGIDKVYFKPVLAILDLPKFVWALAFGVILRNVLTNIFRFNMFDRAIDVFGNASLSLFLAMALLDLKLWQLTALALPVTIILLVQVVVMALYATFITYTLMGRDYDAAVLAAGHCGFGLGATPTAVANMQSVTERFGPSHKAFLIVPMVGAFLVDLINAGLLQTFVKAIH
ncbi:Glutamate permease [Cardiobacterium hominis]|uniref:Sodium/glutamate symporter n=1 Tax=Cardiobacterium hominis (strain ATCC 15826 / DSM 8339 / NCTC 10426 / 6573) TaxID=638300 RepID=C8N7Q7_CARH6|nr:sodium/glutamate symporter [Cardiobacterium hominis]EEV89363.1 sodium/glutamate symporter [Cardiobacterium hominis ATCC 15826]VEG77146.1 Glutamate permease [Cardiobacterium hominis]